MKKLLLVALSLLLMNGLRAQLLINEIMQSNIDCIMDDINEFPDSWVELYNAGSEAVDLSEYKLGEKEDASLAWKLPSGKLGAKCYQLIYCDTEATSNRKHTDFRLDVTKGATLYLFQGDKIVDQLPDMKKMPAPNIAFGRKNDGGDEWGYQDTPTPEAANCGTVYSNKQILGEPVFSEPGKVVTDGNAFNVALSVPEGMPAGTEIRWTADGSEPTAQSALYTGKISITATKVIRAKLFCEGYLSPRSTTHSYIMFPKSRKLTLPVISINTDRKFFYDNKIGIWSKNKYTDGKENYNHDWRRPINFEYFENANEESRLNQLGETRVTGGATRDKSLKSLAVYANKRFGTSRLEYEFFEKDRPGITDFKSIMLRNSGNDFDGLYMRDAIIQRSMAAHFDIDWQGWSPAIIYLNGTYLGILNIRERSNEHNIFTNYQGLEDIDMIENYKSLKVGTMENWSEFEKFYKTSGQSYSDFKKYLDVDEFMNVMIFNVFFCNLDFPGNNIVWWRPRAEGGRWRILVKDVDFGLGLYSRPVDYNYLKWLHNPNYDWSNNWGANSTSATQLFRTLESNSEFLREYIDRFLIYMGDFMNFSGVWETWGPMYDIIKTEYPYHRALINQWWPNYNDEMNSAKNWIKNRTGKMYDQLVDYYKLGKACNFSINRSLTNSEIEKMSITMNGVKLSKAKLDGKFCANRAISLKGENIVGWRVSVTSTAGNITDKEVSGSEYSFTMPECSSCNITAIYGATDIESVDFDDSDENIFDASEIYDASGVRQREAKEGLNVIRRKDGTTKKVWR